MRIGRLGTLSFFSMGLMIAGLSLIGGGCSGEQKKTGTQVEVSSDMQEEALAQDRYFEEQTKTKKAP
ncbi:MAG: hypothetical protein IRY99_13390 [Isosphaeraceae bacterium]|nr:hypothetical protein [Isosphaeraceae bacterium]